MRRAATGTGNGVPGIRDCFVGSTGARVAEKDGEAGETREIDFLRGFGCDGEGYWGDRVVGEVRA